MSTLSEYNNNPGNIRPPGGKANFYEGQIGVDENGFAVFINKDFGRKALVQDIRTKMQKGVNTPHSFIDRYAPAGKENTEDSRDNYKLTLTSGLGLKGTNEPFPPGSEEKIADLIAKFEGQSAPQQTAETPAEPRPGDALRQPIPGLEKVLSTEPGPPPAKAPQTEEVISPEAAAAAGAATTAFGQIPFTPEVPERVDLTGAQTKADVAQSKAELAQQRLQERTGQYEAARQAQVEAEARMAPRTPPAAPAAGSLAQATPQVVTGEPSGSVPTAQQHERLIGAATGDTLGTTSIQRERGQQETAHAAAEERKRIAETRQEMYRRGLVSSPLEPRIPELQAPSISRAGLIIPPNLAAEEQIQQQIEAQRSQEQRMAEAQEMERIKNEAALAKRGATRAQTVAEARRTRAEEAQIDLAAARKAAPGPVAQALRPAEVTGAKAGKAGFFSRGIAGGALGAYGAMSLNELVDRYNKGDRSPELLKELGGALSAGAALTPAIGPKTSRVKGAGLLGAGAAGAYDVYRMFTEEERRLLREQELREKMQGAKNLLTP